jgi:hypothetical protein
MYLWTRILDVLSIDNGMRCVDLAKQFNTSYNTMSGSLSRMKHLGKIRNSNGLWYANINTPIEIIKSKIDSLWNDENINNQIWFEGYVSAMADVKFIDEKIFDQLIIYIQNK